MYIKELEYKSDPSYAAFAEKHGTIFNSPQWLDVYSSGIKVAGIYNDNHELIGAFNVYIEKRYGFSFVKTPPFSPHIALVYVNPAVQLHQRNTFVKKVNKLIADYLETLNPAVSFLAFPPEHPDVQDFFWRKYNASPNYTYRYSLGMTEKELFYCMSDKKRNSINKAERDGLTIVEKYDPKLIFDLVQQTYDRKSKDLNAALLIKILHRFTDREKSICVVAEHDGQAAALCFCICDRNTAYYLLGGYFQKTKHSGAGALALWTGIKIAKQRGLNVFDFEGSMLPEVEENFREYGADLVPYQTITRASPLFSIPLKIMKPQMF